MSGIRKHLRLLAAADFVASVVLLAIGWSVLGLIGLVLAIDAALLSVVPDRWLRAVARLFARRRSVSV